MGKNRVKEGSIRSVDRSVAICIQGIQWHEYVNGKTAMDRRKNIEQGGKDVRVELREVY